MAYDWRDDANCAGIALSVFFHPDGERGPERLEREAEAKAYCQDCPVWTDCLDEAFTFPREYGTWGGLSERERRRIRRRRTVDVREYVRLRAAGVQPAAAAALTASAPVTEVAVGA